MIRYIDMAARIAAIRTEIAEHGHHPGPDSLTNQDLLALCDEVEDMRALLHGVGWRQSPNGGWWRLEVSVQDAGQ